MRLSIILTSKPACIRATRGKAGERRPERRTVVRWVKEDDFVLRSQSVSVSTRSTLVQLILLSFVASGLPDMNRRGVGSSESKTMDAPDCQHNVKLMSFLVQVVPNIVEAIENCAELLQI